MSFVLRRNGHVARQISSYFLWNPVVYEFVHTGVPLDSIPDHINPGQINTTCLISILIISFLGKSFLRSFLFSGSHCEEDCSFKVIGRILNCTGRTTPDFTLLGQQALPRTYPIRKFHNSVD
jgi:hypothetical protein